MSTEKQTPTFDNLINTADQIFKGGVTINENVLKLGKEMGANITNVLGSIEDSDKVATERHQELMYMLRQTKDLGEVMAQTMAKTNGKIDGCLNGVVQANQAITGMQTICSGLGTKLDALQVQMTEQKADAQAKADAMKALFDKLSATPAAVVEQKAPEGVWGKIKYYGKKALPVLGGVAAGVGGTVLYNEYLGGETITVELPSSQPAYPQ
jgi:hypothetical protein